MYNDLEVVVKAFLGTGDYYNLVYMATLIAVGIVGVVPVFFRFVFRKLDKVRR